MSKAQFYNKGTMRGTLTKSELVEYNSRSGKDKFLAIEVTTADGNKGKATIFNTRSNPNKAQSLHQQFPVGTKVEVAGTVKEREYERRDGEVGIDRSINAYHMGQMNPTKREGVLFILQGIIKQIREIPNGVMIRLAYEERFTRQSDNTEVVNEYLYTLEGDERIAEMVFNGDIQVGCNIKAKGQMLNKLEFDDYGDILGSTQCFSIEKIENIIQPEDLEAEELDFI